MTSKEDIAAFQKKKLVEAVGVVWVTKSGKKARVPMARECPGCHSQYRLKGGKPDEHFCRILHCHKCKGHFCWFCLYYGPNYGIFPCVTGNDIFELCNLPVKKNA